MKYSIRIVTLSGVTVYLSDKNRLSWCKKTATKKADELKKDHPLWNISIEES